MYKTRNYPIMVFGNISNNLMIGYTEEAYTKGMNLVMPRKIWYAQKGDVIVIPTAVDEGFMQYVYGLLGLEKSDIEIVVVPGPHHVTITDRISDSPQFEQLKEIIEQKPGIKMMGFGYDNSTLELAKSLGIELFGYNSYPSQETIDIFYKVNTKSGFREVAQSLGLLVGDGKLCIGTDSLVEDAANLLGQYEKIILKFDRSSNGFGHKVITTSDFSSTKELEAIILDHVAQFPNQPKRFVIEKYEDFVSLPSIELNVTNECSSELYSCDQYCYNNSWAGMITPPLDLDPEIMEKLQHAGKVFGEFVHSKGFRGICDVDGGVTKDGDLIVTESNFRRTGGTYLDFIVRRLVDKDYYTNNSCFWLADTKKADMPDYKSFEETIAFLKSEGLLFDKETKQGVILTCHTYESDNKWRYLIIGPTADYVKQFEIKLGALLGFPFLQNV